MKKKTHPEYQEVLFVDSSTGCQFVCGTTLKPKEMALFEGKEYPVYHVAVSSASHPFFTRKQQFIDTEGRVQKFANRYKAQADKKVEVKVEEPPVKAKKVVKDGKKSRPAAKKVQGT